MQEALVRQHSLELDAIVAAAIDDALSALLSQDVRDINPDEYQADISAIVREYAQMAGGAGADFYSELRSEAGLRGFQPKIVTGLNSAAMKAVARWSIGPMYGAEPNANAARSRLEGGIQRLVADADRKTVAGNVERDPARARWYRATSAKACAFCAMLATRGAVYRSSESALRSHNHCRCLAVPVFGDKYKLPSHYATFAAEYDEARKAVTQAGGNATAKNILAAWRAATERS